ncbi:MAG: hypothetical protein Q9191_000204 [Dirinaria sp. TL-2023a]
MASSTTPAVSVDGLDGEYDFRQMIQQQQQQQQQHMTQLPHEQFAVEGSGYIHSGTNSTYGSPEPSNHLIHHYGYKSSYPHQYSVLAEGQADEYGTPMFYPNPTSGYYASPPAHQTQPYHNYYASSPPTPAASDPGSNGKRKREARSLAPSRSVSRTSHSPKPKRSKQAKGEKAKVPQIEAPLSVLTKDYENIPVKDMNAWVNRSAEVRQSEVEKRKGKITRPMNSFMLYRSAYAERTKVWCLQNNHQVVSSVSGESWPMEPREIRDLYTEYARIERDNHQKAHPGYKFSPSKAGAAARKRRETSEEEEEPSDLDDLDTEWKPARARNPKLKEVQRMPEAVWPANITANPLKSSYQYTNPGKPLPAPTSHEEMYGHYYQTSVRQNFGHPFTEDVFVQRHQMPDQSYGTQSPLVGMPGRHFELLDEPSVEQSPSTLDDTQVDPFLLNADDDEFGGLPATQYDSELFETANMEPITYEDDPTFTQGAEAWKFAEDTNLGA